jgi:hypothetical protein
MGEIPCRGEILLPEFANRKRTPGGRNAAPTLVMTIPAWARAGAGDGPPGGGVIAVSACPEAGERAAFRAGWDRRCPHPRIRPRRRRCRILQNQRGLLLATVPRASTGVVICAIPCRLTSR